MGDCQPSISKHCISQLTMRPGPSQRSQAPGAACLASCPCLNSGTRDRFSTQPDLQAESISLTECLILLVALTVYV